MIFKDYGIEVIRHSKGIKVCNNGDTLCCVHHLVPDFIGGQKEEIRNVLPGQTGDFSSGSIRIVITAKGQHFDTINF